MTARYCVAIGDVYGSRNGSTGFTEIWNGRGWTYASVPGKAGEAASLSCPASGYCVAAGTQDGGVPAGFGQLWDGTHWAQTAMPWPHETLSYLYGVSCAGKTCQAVGAAAAEAADGNAGQPAALTWNGTSWIRQATAPGTVGTLFGVTCVTAADCVAVGSQAGGSTRSLAEFWNGTARTKVNPT